jgi:hypothetical protein
MQYALLIYEDEQATGKNENGPIYQRIVAGHRELSPRLRQEGIQVGGAGLKSTASATTLRQSNGARTLHDGPFAESKEQLGGFYLVDVADLDAAIAVARRMPLAEGGSIEIRPVIGQG